MNRINILDELRKSKKYDIALFTTFNFEISFFERNILRKLLDNSVKKVSLFVDSNELTKSLGKMFEYGYTTIGKNYRVTPIKINSSFHPKVTLLMGKNKARLIVGSCNLTTSGYYINNEVVNVYDYDEKNKENLGLIRKAVDFFNDINNMSDKRDASLIKQAKNYSYVVEKGDNEDINDNIQFLSNVNDSILSQVKNIIKDEVVSIDIAVPYYDANNNCLKEIINEYHDATINLYIQNKTSTFPKKDVDKYNINIFNGVSLNSDKASYNFYHGKTFRFNTENKSYILFGSANCTKSAFLSSKKDGGNVEADILCVGEKNDFDYYFEYFKISDDEVLESELIHYDKSINGSCSFLYNDGNTLHFHYTGDISNLMIRILDYEMDYEYNDKEISVFVLDELKGKLDCIFQVFFNDESVYCYFDEKDTIDYNRNQFREEKEWDINIEPDLDASNDIYRKERIELLIKMSEMYDILRDKTYEQYKNVIDSYNPDNIDAKDDEIETNEEIEFINRDYEFSHKNNINNIEKLHKATRYIFDRFYDSFFNLKTYLRKEEIKISDNPGADDSGHNNSRGETSENRKLVKAVKRIINDMLNKENSKLLDFSRYVGSVVTLFELFNGIIIKKGNIDLFNPSDVIEWQFRLIEELSSKLEDNPTEEKEKKMFIGLSLSCILQCNIMGGGNAKIELRNKELLNRIDRALSIRGSIRDYLDAVVSFVDAGKEIVGKDQVERYFDRLFGYKTSEQLDSYLAEVFGNEFLCSAEEESFIILAKADTSQFLALKRKIVKEIERFYKGKGLSLHTIHIDIENNNINPIHPNPIYKLEYNINFIYRKKSYMKATRRNGVGPEEDIVYKD
ncbi:MAG: hypothetical protein K6E24_00235 [bacterium]|nr:hypothetical protein [bacterium]